MNGHEHSGIPTIAAIGRHPIHPMLVPLPIGFFVGALLTDLAYAATANPFWAEASLWLVAAGLVGGAAAATAGLVDFLGSPRIRGLYHAWYHLISNGLALALALVSLILRIALGASEAVLPWGLVLSAIVLALVTFAGWHGGEMVFGHGVGMQPHVHGPHEADHHS